MNEAEIEEALGTLSQSQAVAVFTILTAAWEQSADAVAVPELTNEVRQYNAGRLAMTSDLRDDWKTRVDKARRAVAA
jgi:hypothetical protein